MEERSLVGVLKIAKSKLLLLKTKQAKGCTEENKRPNLPIVFYTRTNTIEKKAISLLKILISYKK